MSGSSTFYLTIGNNILQYNYNQQTNQIQLVLGQNFSQTADFTITALSPFLQTQNGLYLGQTYTPQIKIGSTLFYLQQVNSTTSIYNLVSNPNSSCFSLIPLDTSTMTVEANNFPGFNNLTMVSTGQPITFYSPTQCINTCTICGPEVCPENFTCANGQCATQLPINAAFGIRLKNGNSQYVYTYSVVGNSLIVDVVEPNQISASLEKSGMPRERWFFADYLPGQQQLVAGQTYPLYTFINGQKYYISNPVGQTYQLTTKSNGSTLTFKPTQPVNWQDFSFDPSQFLNFYLPSTLSSSQIALWQNYGFKGMTAVNSAQLTTTTCTTNSQCSTGQVCLNGTCQSCTANSQCPTGQVCQNGVCQSCSATVSCPTGQICQNGTCVTSGCTSNSQCTGGQICDQTTGQCQPCNTTAQCPTGQYCINGSCKTPTCTSNAQCTGGQVCSNGQCTSCTANSQCTSGQICNNGVCMNPPSTPFWKTWWFWILVAFFILIIVFVIGYLIYLNQRKKFVTKSTTTTTRSGSGAGTGTS